MQLRSCVKVGFGLEKAKTTQIMQSQTKFKPLWWQTIQPVQARKSNRQEPFFAYMLHSFSFLREAGAYGSDCILYCIRQNRYLPDAYNFFQIYSKWHSRTHTLSRVHTSSPRLHRYTNTQVRTYTRTHILMRTHMYRFKHTRIHSSTVHTYTLSDSAKHISKRFKSPLRQNMGLKV